MSMMFPQKLLTGIVLLPAPSIAQTVKNVQELQAISYDTQGML
jgi:hypothetical protein